MRLVHAEITRIGGPELFTRPAASASIAAPGASPVSMTRRAQWLAKHDAERIAAEREAERAAHRLPDLSGVVARRKERTLRRRRLPEALKCSPRS